MLNLKIVPDNSDPYDLTVTTRDIAKWERTTKGASFAGLQSDMHVKDVYAVAFHAATRRGLFAGSLKEFEESVDFDILGEEEADPTRSAVS